MARAYGMAVGFPCLQVLANSTGTVVSNVLEVNFVSASCNLFLEHHGGSLKD